MVLSDFILNASKTNSWTNVYGLGRSLIAANTLITLLSHDVGFLLKPAGRTAEELRSNVFMSNFSIFNIVPHEYDFITKLMCISILILVIIGWRPRITGGLHWLVSFSFATSCVIIDGGDQIAADITFLLIPVTLTDSRKNHWFYEVKERSVKSDIFSLIAISFLTVIRLQVSSIYFQAGVSKMSVTEWQNGTAIYYWFTHPTFGLIEPLRAIMIIFLSNAYFITIMTWSVIIFEVIMSMGLVMNKKFWKYLLILGLTFHFSILIIHGLFTFFFVMAGAIILYLRPIDQNFSFSRLKGLIKWKNVFGVTNPIKH